MPADGKSNNALVIGGGIAGIKAALELAEIGHLVYLCDKKPYVGGTLLQLDRWFPDDHCGMCKVLPVFSRDTSSQYCLRRGLVHPNIEILACSEVTQVDGEAGSFAVTVSKQPGGVDPDRCIGCGKCSDVCPVEIEEEFNQGLSRRKAVYLANPLALSKTYTIDPQQCTRCNACVDVCPTRAIDLSRQSAVRQLDVGAIILSTGFEEFDPKAASQYGYKRFPNIVSSLELERILSGSGPTRGALVRPSDNKEPRSVAFLQCVGSRSLERNYCSSACCMYALKEAMLIKERYPDIDVCIYFMDLRAFGKGYYRYYQKARDDLGIRFNRCRVPRVMQNFKTHDVAFSAIGQDGTPIEETFDFVVLSVGQTPSPQFRQAADMLGLQLNRWGFCRTQELAPVVPTRAGVFICGSASAPKDIADTLAEAGAAAWNASLVLSRPAAPEKAALSADKQRETKAAVFVCNCGGELSAVVDTRGLAAHCRELPDVIHSEEVTELCRADTLAQAKTKIKEMGVGRVLAAGCSALVSQGLFGDIPTEIVNIREGLAWVHREAGSAANQKARDLVAMALAKQRFAHVSQPSKAEAVTSKALVVGAGIAGLTAALSIAKSGYRVDLIELTGELGGHLKHIHSTLEGADVQSYLQALVAQVTDNPRLTVWLQATVSAITGHAGSFHVSVTDSAQDVHDIDAGAIVLAAGAEEHTPHEYLYGRHESVLTQRELEERIHDGRIDATSLQSVVMIQCVGSRDSDRPFCSRVCCAQALKNALRLKDHNPNAEIIVLYRDLMSYGFMEEYYTAARERGVLFARYDLDDKPLVQAENNTVRISARDTVLGETITRNPDLVVLSTGIVPAPNAAVAQLLNAELDEDGFFKEAEVKFRPVDLIKDGIYVCGLAHSPRRIPETIVQAQAAAERACLILARTALVSGRSVSEVNETWCSGCELCVQACPFDARIKDEEKGVAAVIEALCQGCGACVTTCPNKAAKLRGWTDKQILAALDEAL